MSTPALKKKKLSRATEKVTPHVLAVDDQPTCLSILSLLVEAQGASVEAARDGKEALSMWTEKQHPLIITDCNMPIMDGFSLAKAIRHAEQASNSDKSTIVALSSNNTERETQLCINAGVDYVLSKPVDRKQIEAILSQWRNQQTENHEVNHTSSAANQNHHAPIDYSVLTSIFPDVLKHQTILVKLQKHLQEDFQALDLEIELANLLEAERLAHRMKGACKMVGANNIAMVCEEIESEAKKGKAVQDSLISTLAQRIDELNIYLSQQIRFNDRNPLNGNGHANT